jgi:hypothetical protein
MGGLNLDDVLNKNPVETAQEIANDVPIVVVGVGEGNNDSDEVVNETTLLPPQPTNGFSLAHMNIMNNDNVALEIEVMSTHGTGSSLATGSEDGEV